MTEDQLLTFITVNKYSNFSKAAEELIVSQPTVTSRIKTLELELDCSLFNRSGYTLALTPEGKVLLEYAINALNFMNQAKTAVQSLKKTTVKIGFAPAFSRSIILSTINNFKKGKDVHVFIYEADSSSELLKKVQNKEIDIGFARLKGDVHSNLESEYLLEDKLVLICSKSKFPHKTEITINDLDKETILVHKRNTNLWKLISEELLAINYFDNIETSSLELLKEMLKEDWGSTIIHLSSLEANDHKELKIIPFKELFFNVEQKIYVVNNKDEYIPKYFNEIKQNFVQAVLSLKNE